jgi:hypothetical protein
MHMVFISHSWFDMQGLVRHTISFQFDAIYGQTNWCHRGFTVWFTGSSPQSLRTLYNDLVCQYNLPLNQMICCLICFIPTVTLFLTRTLTLTMGLLLINMWEIGLTAIVTVGQGMLTPPKHLTPPLFALSFISISFRTYQIDGWSLCMAFY